MSTKFNRLPEQVNQQARDWFTLMQASEITGRDRQQLNEWLSRSPEHREAYQQLEAIWHGLGELAT
ncbi:MAG: FecR/PupR family sigma factor regulator, partial [Pseudomonadales bacterium]